METPKIAFILLEIDRPDILPDNKVLEHEIEVSINFGNPRARFLCEIEAKE